jgi:hypothetical protein
MVLVPDLMKSLRDQLTRSSRRTGANAGVDHVNGRSRHWRDHLTVDSTTQLLIPTRTKTKREKQARSAHAALAIKKLPRVRKLAEWT